MRPHKLIRLLGITFCCSVTQYHMSARATIILYLSQASLVKTNSRQVYQQQIRPLTSMTRGVCYTRMSNIETIQSTGSSKKFLVMMKYENFTLVQHVIDISDNLIRCFLSIYICTQQDDGSRQASRQPQVPPPRDSKDCCALSKVSV